MTSYLNNGHEVINYFAKFENFLPHSIIIPSFMTVGSHMPELDRRGLFVPSPPPPYKVGSQNTPYKLGLKVVLVIFQQYHYLEIEGGLHHFRTAYVLV